MDPKDDQEIIQLADGFVQAIRDNSYERKGYSSSMYGMSKLAEVSYTLWLARQVKSKVRAFTALKRACTHSCLSGPIAVLMALLCTMHHTYALFYQMRTSSFASACLGCKALPKCA